MQQIEILGNEVTPQVCEGSSKLLCFWQELKWLKTKLALHVHWTTLKFTGVQLQDTRYRKNWAFTSTCNLRTILNWRSVDWNFSSTHVRSQCSYNSTFIEGISPFPRTSSVKIVTAIQHWIPVRRSGKLNSIFGQWTLLKLKENYIVFRKYSGLGDERYAVLILLNATVSISMTFMTAWKCSYIFEYLLYYDN